MLAKQFRRMQLVARCSMFTPTTIRTFALSKYSFEDESY